MNIAKSQVILRLILMKFGMQLSYEHWSHGTKIFGSKISLHKAIQVPWCYFVGF